MNGEETAFDRKLASWVRHAYPGSDPITGTVEFSVDVSSYGGELDTDLDVDWSENQVFTTHDGKPLPGGRKDHSRTITQRLNYYDLTALMRELHDMEDPG